jgi:hypothetical protein
LDQRSGLSLAAIASSGLALFLISLAIWHY